MPNTEKQPGNLKMMGEKQFRKMRNRRIHLFLFPFSPGFSLYNPLSQSSKDIRHIFKLVSIKSQERKGWWPEFLEHGTEFWRSPKHAQHLQEHTWRTHCLLQLSSSSSLMQGAYIRKETGSLWMISAAGAAGGGGLGNGSRSRSPDLAVSGGGLQP